MKALIAMSGGVDSSVAAKLVIEEGYECIGCTMKLFHNEDAEIPKEHTCCSLDDVEDARSVCYRMGIKYYVFNFSERFKEDVMDRFVDAYEHGCTPNPCIDCNRYLKFDKMFQRMRELEYDYIVTGHYARVEYDERKAFDGADFIYAKNWSAYRDPHYGQVINMDRSWTVDAEKMALTNNAYFMHCLPVRRNMIVTDDVIESPQSIVIPEAANREISAQTVLKRLLAGL